MNVKNIVIFISGLGMGAAGMWFGLKAYYEELANEEIQSVKDWYREKENYAEPGEVETLSDEDKKEYEVDDTNEEEPDYREIIERMNYSDFSKKKEEPEEMPEDTINNGSYIITPDDFIDNPNYDKVTLTYFEDDEIFTDIEENVIPDGNTLVGNDNLKSFGEYEENTLFVRNELLGTDYEVILEEGSYAEFMASGE